ncbi:MAG TPA: hypothetical protein VLV45_05490, partial [Gemmatimonadales bacterium]|nr:hypothetical protein [Gemmatimonadales bacterium]
AATEPEPPAPIPVPSSSGSYGGRLRLSTLAVLVCVLFWWFLWGVAGVLLAVPIAATLKALGDQVPRLAPMGEFPGE